MFAKNFRHNNTVLILLVLSGAFILWSLRDYFDALLGAILIYVLFRPPFIYLVGKRGLSVRLAALGVILVSFFVVILPLLFFSLMIAGKLIDFQQNPLVLKRILHNADLYFSGHLGLPHFIDRVLEKAQESTFGFFSYVINGTASLLVLLAIMYLLIYFMFAGYLEFERSLVKYMPFKERYNRKFTESLKHITYSSVIGQGVIAFLQGVLVVIGFKIFGLNDAFFWGVMSMFLSFLPVVGAPTTMLVAGLVELSNGGLYRGIGSILWGIVLIGSFDSILRFLLAKKIGNIPPLITILGVLLGLPAFGILGLVFGPLLLSYFTLLIRIYEDEKAVTGRYNRIKNLDIR